MRIPEACKRARRRAARFRVGARIPLIAAWLAAAAALVPLALHAQVNVLTNRYDAQRTGANLSETTLTAANVNPTQFGRLYAYAVDGAVYAQPLYMSGVVIAGTPRNVLYVATMNDKVYAFDADSPSSTPLWMKDFTSPPAVTAVPVTDITPPNRNMVGNVGIQGTPVIDPATGTLFLVARTKESGVYAQRLHALDVATGAERAGSPAAIAGSVEGTAPDSTVGTAGRVITFDPKVHIQRAGLALSNGVVLVAWAAHEDIAPSHGWIMGFDARTLARVAIVAVTPDAYLGGIWQGGRAPALDAAGNAYFATGNGTWDGTRNFGNSLLKFRVGLAGLTLLDYFTPGNEAQLTIADNDLSGSGFTLLPGTSLLLGGGKEGVLYLLDANNLGHKVAKDTQIVQKLPVSGGHVMGGVVSWTSPAAGALVYNWSEDDVLKAYSFSGGRLTTVPYAQGDVVSPGHPGGSLTLSANGSRAGTGIVWASMPTNQDGIHGLVAGILRAFDAETLREVWSSEQNAARDRAGTLVKFVPPVVARGKVYLATNDGAVAVYGLLPADFSLSVAPGGRTVAPGSRATFSVSVGAAGGYAEAVSLSASGQPAGVAVSFDPPVLTGSGTATMTVAVPSTAASGSFWITVTGTSAPSGRTRSASPVVVNVNNTSAGLGAIGINFVGSSPTGMAANETAGTVLQSHWNNATGAVRSAPLALVDQSGTASGATATWAANNTWQTPIADQSGNPRLMKGYLDTPGPSTTVAIAGLAQGTYDVYVYADGDNRSYARSAAYTISGPGIAQSTVGLTDAASTDFATAFTPAVNSNGNYVKFTVTGSGFTITATPTVAATATLRAAINAVQIVPSAPGALPAPIGINFTGASTALMAAGEVAGVIPAAHWNNAAGPARSTPLLLADGNGAASTASVTWASASTWITPVLDQAGNRRMMKGYLDTTTSSSSTVTLSGLPKRLYDIYVYVDGDNRGYTRTARYSISGPGLATMTSTLSDAANTNFVSTFVDGSGTAGNYLKFTIDGTGFTLTATPLTGGNTTLRAPLNGLQIIAADGAAPQAP